MSTILYIIAGFALFAVLRLIGRIMHSEIGYDKIHPLFFRIFPVLEFVLWFLYLLWALNGIFRHWPFFDILMYSIIIAIVIGLGWFLFKDFIAGIVLKSEIDFYKDQYISLPLAEGKVKRLGFRSLVVETENGQRVKIPYSRLSGEIITCQSKTKGLKAYETKITVKHEIKEEQMEEIIRNKVMLLPWTLPMKKPQVKLIHEKSNSQREYLVKYFAINEQHANKIANYIEEEFDKKDTREDEI